MEGFQRSILSATTVPEASLPYIAQPATANVSASVMRNPLCGRIVGHMHRTNEYRNPDISLNRLASELYTNRTSLAKALHELGYNNFNAYINSLRLEDFINRICNQQTDSYQAVFYDVGFRSRATALRNFKRYTGKTPSEYFAIRNTD